MGDKQSHTHQEVLERNAIRWIVTDMKAFIAVESPEYQQMFRDIPGIEPPFTSRHTLRDRITQEFRHTAHQPEERVDFDVQNNWLITRYLDKPESSSYSRGSLLLAD